MARPDQRVEFTRLELLDELGWRYRTQFMNSHEFPDPAIPYRSITETSREFARALDQFTAGYIALVGSPGSGKSTLATRALRESYHRVVRCYAYGQGASGGSMRRGEAVNFLDDADSPALRAPDGTVWSVLRDAPYGVSEVSFEARDGFRLEGVLLEPRSPSGRGAVLLHGSGNSDRDNVWAYTFAHALAQEGVTVLFPDKRGSGGSGGDWREVGLDTLARDAVSGAEELARRSGLPPDSIGWVGLSQGGWVAPLAARMSGRGAFVISVSSAAVPVFDQLEFEVANNLREEGLGPDAVVAAHELQSVFRQRALGRIPWSEYEDARNEAVTGPAAAFAESTPADPSSWLWSWWARVGEFDPLESWAAVGLPILVLYGAEDELDNVPVEESVRRLRSLQSRPAPIQVDYVVYDDLGHMLVDAAGWVSATALERLTTFALRNR